MYMPEEGTGNRPVADVNVSVDLPAKPIPQNPSGGHHAWESTMQNASPLLLYHLLYSRLR